MPEDHPFPAELEGMRGIRLPEPVSYAPQTVGWWILFAILALLLAVAIWYAVRRYRRNAYRRLALARLASVPLANLPTLVKRTALDAYPRTDVASLADDEWLAFLDASYGGRGFREGPGRVLPALAYDAPDVPPADAEALVSLVERWIRTHRA